MEQNERIETVYLAGRLFNAAERLHNLYLEHELKTIGYKVILPQREATRFFDGESFDMDGLVEDCRKNSADEDSICVVNIDGPDADSGSCVEFGIAVTATGRAVVYRTDFRTDMEKELGVNAMLRLRGTLFVYYPCFFTDLREVRTYYRQLALKLDAAITKVVRTRGYREHLKKQTVA